MGEEQERPFANALGPIVDECLPSLSEGEGLEAWINDYTAYLPVILQRMIKLGGKTWEETDLNMKVSLLVAECDSMQKLSIFAGMIQINHFLLDGFDDLHKRLLLKAGLEDEIRNNNNTITLMESDRAFGLYNRPNFESDKNFYLEQIGRSKDILERLGARVTPETDISRK